MNKSLSLGVYGLGFGVGVEGSRPRRPRQGWRSAAGAWLPSGWVEGFRVQGSGFRAQGSGFIRFRAPLRLDGGGWMGESLAFTGCARQEFDVENERPIGDWG